MSSNRLARYEILWSFDDYSPQFDESVRTRVIRHRGGDGYYVLSTAVPRKRGGQARPSLPANHDYIAHGEVRRSPKGADFWGQFIEMNPDGRIA